MSRISDVSWFSVLRESKRQKSSRRAIRSAAAATIESLEGRTLLSAGQLDSTFGASGEVVLTPAAGTTYASAVQSDGKMLLVGGTTSPSNSTASSFFVERLNADGSIDTTFGTNGVATVAFPDYAVADTVLIQTGGKIVLGGADEQLTDNGISAEQFALARFNTNGTLDTTFGSGGTTLTSIPGMNGIESLAFAPDGKIVAAGRGTYQDPAHPGDSNYSATVVLAARYSADGALDTTFNSVGYVYQQTTDFANEIVASNGLGINPLGVAVQPDGKVLLGSDFKIDPTLWRFNTDGSLDTSFGNGGRAWIPMLYFDVPDDDYDCAQISQIIVQPGGKILVAGDDNQSDGRVSWMLGQFNADGSPDSTFGNTSFAPGGGFVDVPLQHTNNSFGSVPRMAIESDGKIVIGGLANNPPGVYEAFRFSASGVLDTSFTDPNYAPDVDLLATTGSMSLTPSGQVIITTNGSNGSGSNARVIRLQTDVASATPIPAQPAITGSASGLNTSFGVGGRTIINDPTSIWLANSPQRTVNATAVQPDGKVVIAGSLGTVATGGIGQIYLERLNADGSVDTTFGANGIVLTSVGPVSYANAIIIQSDGKILIGGATEDSATATTDARFALVRYNADGSIDTTFGVNGILTTDFPGNQQIDSLGVYSNGDIVAAGSYFQFPDVGFDVARYNSVGALETSFNHTGELEVNLGLATAHSYSTSMVLQPDGKLLIGAHSGGLPAILRYNQDGTLDTTFGSSGIAFPPPNDPNGNSVTGGSVVAVSVLSDGSIVAAASDTADLTDIGASLLFKLTTAGQVDATFGTTGGTVISSATVLNAGSTSQNAPEFYGVVAVMPLQDGSVLVAASQPQDDGDFHIVGQAPLLVKVLASGQIDTTFPSNVDPMLEPQPYFRGQVPKAAALGSDGSIFMADEAFGDQDVTTPHWIGVAKYSAASASTPVVPTPPVSTVPTAPTTPPTATVPGDGTTTPTQPTVPTTPISGGTPLPAGQLTATVASSSPAKALAGARGVIIVRIKNAGSILFAGPISIDIYASTDGVPTLDDAKLTNLTLSNLTLKPGKSRNVRVPFTFASNLATGKYLLLANVTEAAAGTAAFTAATRRAMAITAATVDLSVKFTPAKALKLKSGKTAKAVLIIRNTGNTAAVGTYSINLAASSDATLSINDQSLTNVTNARLKIAAKGSKRVTIAFNPTSTLGSAYDLIATLTSASTPQDLNVTNNAAVVVVKVS